MNENVDGYIEIIQVVDIDVTAATFSVWFNVKLEWHDHRVYFTYLKNNSIENTVSLSTEKGIWIPILTMELIVPGTEHLIVKALIVRREREPIMTYDNDVLRSAEKYHGKYNPFILNQRIQAKFCLQF